MRTAPQPRLDTFDAAAFDLKRMAVLLRLSGETHGDMRQEVLASATYYCKRLERVIEELRRDAQGPYESTWSQLDIDRVCMPPPLQPRPKRSGGES